MKKEIADKWVKALRSGKYEQSRGALNDLKGFCCLGVLCDLYDPKQWDEVGDYLRQSLHPPAEVIDWAGMKNAGGKYGLNSFLTNDNDGGTSFGGIADIIEKYWKSL